MSTDDFLDRIEDDEEELYHSYIKPVHPLKAKIFVWLTILSGISIGICLFLFFLTIFLYVFLPLIVLFLIWFSIKRWRSDREWRRIEKKFYEQNLRDRNM